MNGLRILHNRHWKEVNIRLSSLHHCLVLSYRGRAVLIFGRFMTSEAMEGVVEDG